MSDHITTSPHHHITIFVVIALSMNGATSADSPFATRVIEYTPAPGQFVNNPKFNNPAVALGPPSGGGTSAPNNESVVTLGGFGGYIVLGFDHPILDDPLNPFGLDAIVFSNAYWVGGNPDRHWAECATIEISRDDNANGLADDPWFLIPGSYLAGPLARTIKTWDGGAETYAYALPVELFGAIVVVNPQSGEESEGIFGYAEYAPTLFLGDLDGDDVIDDDQIAPEDFYTVPDDPFEVGMTRGCGGGDAFDIAWAIEPATGLPAGLTGFDFVRITNPLDIVVVPVGEKSPEIDAVADVAPDTMGDADDDGDIDLEDAAELQKCLDRPGDTSEACGRVASNENEPVSLSDAARLLIRMTGPQ